VLELTGPASDEELAMSLLEKEGVLVHPGYFYDFPSERFLVLSLLTPEETFRQGVERLLRRLADPG
jgi:aspartate/methionine/tyrosine aminotransferase